MIKFNRGPVPLRWIGCPNISESIIAGRFITFKTPLNSAFLSKLDMKDVFMPEMVFSHCNALNLKLGLWIDLTNTNRYYDGSLIDAMGVPYRKIEVRGRVSTPTLRHTRLFIEMVDEFVATHPLELIAVHCTHGFNRTGFLIVSYIVERFDVSVKTALNMFASARPPGIYRRYYITELYRRYEPRRTPIRAPRVPD